MADETQAPSADGQQEPVRGGVQVHPAFFDAVNAYLAVSEEQTRKYGLREASLAIIYAAARLNTHGYLSSVKPIHAADERNAFLDYMTTMYRRMLNEHLDGMGEERGIDVGDSELAPEYAAAGVRVGRMKQQTPAGDYVAATGATPPAASNE